MKKIFLFLFILFVSFAFFSCSSKKNLNIFGTWNSHVLLKSELGNGADSLDSPVAIMYTNQDISISFGEGGVYTRSRRPRPPSITATLTKKNLSPKPKTARANLFGVCRQKIVWE